MSSVAWSGRGYVVGLINLATAGLVFGSWYLLGMLPGSRSQVGLAFLLWGLTSGAAIFFWARAADAQAPTTLIDKDSGREFEVHDGAGTFGYVASRHNAWLNVLGGAALAYSVAYTSLLARYGL